MEAGAYVKAPSCGLCVWVGHAARRPFKSRSSRFRAAAKQQDCRAVLCSPAIASASALQATVTGLWSPVPFTNHRDQSNVFFISLWLFLIKCANCKRDIGLLGQLDRFSRRISWVLLLTAETLRGLTNSSSGHLLYIEKKQWANFSSDSNKSPVSAALK